MHELMPFLILFCYNCSGVLSRHAQVNDRQAMAGSIFLTLVPKLLSKTVLFSVFCFLWRCMQSIVKNPPTR
jgi:hypothetical protein